MSYKDYLIPENYSNPKKRNLLNEDNLPPRILIKSRQFSDESNKRYGSLQVLYPCGRNNDKRIVFVAKCDCGNFLIVDGKRLRSGNTRSCGCYHSRKVIKANENRSPIKIGEVFGKLTVIKLAGYRTDSRGKRSRYWLCQCECGSKITVRHDYLKNGDTKSCGCLTSKGELVIEQLLKEHGVDFQREYSFQDLVDVLPLRFDFAIFQDSKLVQLIEFQGAQHTDPNNGYYSKKLIEHDLMKKEYCERNNIKCVYIYYEPRQVITWEDLELEGIV